MGIIRDFLIRRSQTLQQRQKDKTIPDQEQNLPETLTDELFWQIIRQYMDEIRQKPKLDKAEILANILAKYPEPIIQDFGRRFSELNR